MRIVSSGLLIGVALAAGCTQVHSAPQRIAPKKSAEIPSMVVTKTIVIGPGAPSASGATTFAPPPSGSVRQALTETRALSIFEKADKQFAVKRDMAGPPQLGLCERPSHQDRLAWGYHWAATCPLPSHDPFVTATPSAQPLSCVEWLFLDAKTGQMLEGLYQQ